MKTEVLEKLWLVIVMMTLFMIAGCKAESQPAITPGAGASQPQTTVATASPTETGESLAAEIEEIAGAEEPDNACLNCHSDKEQLIATADPEEEVVEESEGEG